MKAVRLWNPWVTSADEEERREGWRRATEVKPKHLREGLHVLVPSLVRPNGYAKATVHKDRRYAVSETHMYGLEVHNGVVVCTSYVNCNALTNIELTTPQHAHAREEDSNDG